MSEFEEVPQAGAKQQEFRPLVYDLRVSDGPDDSYFTNIAAFTEAVIENVEQRAGAILHRYLLHSIDVIREPSASRAQAALDLLTVATAIALYEDSARRVPGWVLSELQKLSWQHERPAMTADILRTALSTAFMKVDQRDGREAAEWAQSNPQVVLDELPHLIEWMQCSFDLTELSRCVVNWLSALRTLPKNEAYRWIETVQELFAWFEVAASDALGRYTTGVSGFLASQRTQSKRRDDRFLRGKRPVEYHLAMVSVEIANRESWRTFIRRPKKVVLVPACMRGVNAQPCPGSQSYGLDVLCAGCDSACNVSRLTQLLKPFKAKVIVINCPRKSIPVMARWAREPRTGIVLVASLGIMQSVQLAARWAQMSCQFLPLDFPGCQSHYLKARIPTTVNQDELLRMVINASLPARSRQPVPCSDSEA